MILKSRNFALAGSIYENLEIDAYTPVYAYFITSYYFTTAARQLCLNADIMDVDRILLVLTFATDESYQKDRVFQTDLLYDALEQVEQV